MGLITKEVIDCHIIQGEQVHVVFQLAVLVEVHVTKHLRYDDYDQRHQYHRVIMIVIMKTIRMIMEMVRM